jgi:hypothetical protein
MVARFAVSAALGRLGADWAQLSGTTGLGLARRRGVEARSPCRDSKFRRPHSDRPRLRVETHRYLLPTTTPERPGELRGLDL